MYTNVANNFYFWSIVLWMITKITCRYSFEVLDFNCNDFGFTFNIGVSYLGIIIGHQWAQSTSTKVRTNWHKCPFPSNYKIYLWDNNKQELLSPKFRSNTGVREGDTLSTILFNLYIKDFKANKNDPISIENTHNNCLKYADDLIIISTSKNDLQHCLNEHDLYCDKWKLQINISKTKIVVFNRQESLINKHKFQFKQNNIEIVSE